MPSPFPGMDPYLEHPLIWPDVHHRLIGAIAHEIEEHVGDRYYVSVERRVYVSEPDEPDAYRIPDVSVISASGNGDIPTLSSAQQIEGSETSVVTVQLPVPDQIREYFLEVRDLRSGRLVTAIELLSPTNKRPGVGRASYESKRIEILATRTNLVEIDLLRAGYPMRFSGHAKSGDYRILVRRGGRSSATLYAFSVRNAIPEFPLPLQQDDEEPVIYVGSLLRRLYDHGRFISRLNYADDPVPPLSEADAEWADRLLRERELR